MWYRVKTGMFAWLIFRITGLALVFYLIMHIHVVSSLANPAAFDKTMNFLGSPLFRILELGLLAAVLIHAMNGVRILIVDFGKGALYQAKLFWILFAVGIVLFIAGSYPMISHALHAKDTAGINLQQSEEGAGCIVSNQSNSEEANDER